MNADYAACEWLVITIAGKIYSLPVAEVESVLVLRRNEISPVPFSDKSRIRGIFNHNGSVVGLLSCKDMITEADKTNKEHLTAVLLWYQRKQFAILVDAAKKVTNTLSDDAITELNAQKLYHGDYYDQN